nr:MAG TPA: hypothetical protein [Caudoviricetes sp.]
MLQRLDLLEYPEEYSLGQRHRSPLFLHLLILWSVLNLDFQVTHAVRCTIAKIIVTRSKLNELIVFKVQVVKCICCYTTAGFLYRFPIDICCDFQCLTRLHGVIKLDLFLGIDIDKIWINNCTSCMEYYSHTCFYCTRVVYCNYDRWGTKTHDNALVFGYNQWKTKFWQPVCDTCLFWLRRIEQRIRTEEIYNKFAKHLIVVFIVRSIFYSRVRNTIYGIIVVNKSKLLQWIDKVVKESFPFSHLCICICHNPTCDCNVTGFKGCASYINTDLVYKFVCFSSAFDCTPINVVQYIFSVTLIYWELRDHVLVVEALVDEHNRINHR